MKRIVLSIIKFGLVSFVVAYVSLPDLVDSKYGVLAGLAVVVLIILMAAYGLKAEKTIRGRKR